MVASALMGLGQLLGLPIQKTKGIAVSQPTVRWYKLGVLEPHISIITGCRLAVSLLNFPFFKSFPPLRLVQMELWPQHLVEFCIFWDLSLKPPRVPWESKEPRAWLKCSSLESDTILEKSLPASGLMPCRHEVRKWVWDHSVLWAPHSACCVARGWKDHPLVWGCWESVVPWPFPLFPRPLLRGGHPWRGEVLGFTFPVHFWGKRLLGLSAARSRLSPLPVVLPQLSHSLCARASAPLSILVCTVSKLLTSFVLGFASSGGLK